MRIIQTGSHILTMPPKFEAMSTELARSTQMWAYRATIAIGSKILGTTPDTHYAGGYNPETIKDEIRSLEDDTSRNKTTIDRISRYIGKLESAWGPAARITVDHPYTKGKMTVTVHIIFRTGRVGARAIIVSPRLAYIEANLLSGTSTDTIRHEFSHLMDPKVIGNAARVAKIMLKDGNPNSPWRDWTSDEIEHWSKVGDNAGRAGKGIKEHDLDDSQFDDMPDPDASQLEWTEWEDKHAPQAEQYFGKPTEMDAYDASCVMDITKAAIRRSFRAKVMVLLRGNDKALLDALSGMSTILGGNRGMHPDYADFLASHPVALKRLRSRLCEAISAVETKQNQREQREQRDPPIKTASTNWDIIVMADWKTNSEPMSNFHRDFMQLKDNLRTGRYDYDLVRKVMIPFPIDTNKIIFSKHAIDRFTERNSPNSPNSPNRPRNFAHI